MAGMSKDSGGLTRQQRRALQRAQAAELHQRQTASAQPTFSTKWRSFIRAGETSIISACLVGSISVAGDMAYVVPLLLIAAIVSIASIATEPSLSQYWKTVCSAIVLVAFAGVGLFVYIHQTLQSRDDFAGGGFLQAEQIELVLGKTFTVTVGEPIAMNYRYFNRGALPVYDAQAWGSLILALTEKNSDPHMREVMRKAVVEGYEKFRGKGAMLAVNQSIVNTEWSNPVTQEQLYGLISGEWKLFLLSGGAWRTKENGEPKYWISCNYLTKIPTSGTIRGLPWRICEGG